jgi:sterol 3beta-glucosyltransferase
MCFVFVTLGSEGDVRPYIALACELRYRGYEVVFATSANYARLLKERGIEFIVLKEYEQEFGAFPNWRIINAVKASTETNKDFLSDLWRVSQKADVLIYNQTTYPCYYIADKLGIPSFGAFAQPHHPSKAFPHPFATNGRSKGGLLNIAGFWLFGTLHWLHVRKPINRWRTETLQLPPLSRWDTLIRQLNRRQPCSLYFYSHHLLPRPSDWRSERVKITGYWYLDLKSKYSPSPRLYDFLNSGSPPVFLSIMWNAEKFNERVLKELTDLLEGRLLIQDLHGELKWMQPSKKLFFLTGPIPHEWLFPRIAIAVHHGGLGITMNSIRAGVPIVTIPAGGGHDHGFWSYRIASSGVGINLSGADCKGGAFPMKLAAAINRAIGSDEMKRRAVEMGKHLRAENGLQSAISFIERTIATGASGKIRKDRD